MIYPVYIQIAIKWNFILLFYLFFFNVVSCVPLNENELKNEFKYFILYCVCVIGLNEFRVDSLRGHSPVTDSFTITHYTILFARLLLLWSPN